MPADFGPGNLDGDEEAAAQAIGFPQLSGAL
jgi:hypothetical protein